MQSNNHQIADYPLLLNREFDARGLPCAPRREQGACARPTLFHEPFSLAGAIPIYNKEGRRVATEGDL